MKVAITGASGFVGSLAEKRMAEAGHIVIPLKRPWKLTDNIDVLVHCAAYLPAAYNDSSEVEKCIMDNAVSTFKLLQCAEKYGIRKFVYLSSGQIYKWKNENPEYATASEDDVIDPIERASPYLISKMTGDCLVRSHKGLIQKVVLRPSSIYGSGMKPVGIIHRLLKQIRSKVVVNIGHEDYHTDLVHVEDVVVMIQNCVEREASGAYNVGGGNPVKTVHLAQMLANITGAGINFTDTKPLFGHPALNIDKARRHFKYKPKRLIDGLKSYVESL